MATSSTPACFMASAMAWFWSSRDRKSRRSNTMALSPRALAQATPGASAWLHTTMATRASKLPGSMARTIACMLLPRPEIMMPRRRGPSFRRLTPLASPPWGPPRGNSPGGSPGSVLNTLHRNPFLRIGSHHFPDQHRLGSQPPHRRLVLGRADEHEAQTQVEHPQHLLHRYPAALLDQGEDGKHRPAPPAEDGLEVRGDDAGNVARDAAAGDVSHAAHVHESTYPPRDLTPTLSQREREFGCTCSRGL